MPAAVATVVVAGKSPPPANLARIATHSVIAGAPSAAWWSKQAADVQFRFAAAVRAGMAANETSQQISQRIRAFMDVSARNAMALVRTSVQQVAADSRRETFKRNADIIAGIRQVSKLDERTTDICLAYDGAEWDLDGTPRGETPLPYNGGVPRHWQCRSVEVAITKTWEELGEEAPEGYPEFKPPQSADEWLRGQSSEVQNELLGKERAELWRTGNVPLNQLLDQSGNPMSLHELRARYGEPEQRQLQLPEPRIPQPPNETPFEKARNDAAAWVRNSTGNGYVEFARAIDSDGKEVLSKEGRGGAVSFEPGERYQMRANHAVIVHSHPLEKSLSNGDLNFVASEDLDGIVAASAKGSLYEARFGPDSVFHNARYLTAYTDAMGPLEREYYAMPTVQSPLTGENVLADQHAQDVVDTAQHFATDVSARTGNFQYTAWLHPETQSRIDEAVRIMGKDWHIANPTYEKVIDTLLRRDYSGVQ